MKSRLKPVLEPAIIWAASVVAAFQVRAALALRRVLLPGQVDRRDLPELSSIRRVLVIRLDEIGDLVMTTPLLRELRRDLPRAHITLVVKRGLQELVEFCPYVNEVVTFPCSVPHWKRPFVLPFRALRLGRNLSSSGFDLALLPRREFDLCFAAFLALFSGAPVRVGYTERIRGIKPRLNRGYDLLLTHIVTLSPQERHEVEHNLDLLRYLGISPAEDHAELWPSEGDDAFAAEVFSAAGFVGQPVIALCASSGNSELKQWPPERFAELAAELCRLDAFFVSLGGPGEDAIGARSIENLGPAALNLCGKTTLTQMAAVLRGCDLLISNDTGPMHIAAAVGTPVVALFGSSCQHRYGPWGNHHRVLSLNLDCSPCQTGHEVDRCRTCIYDTPRCMTGITVAQAKDAVIEVLERNRNRVYAYARQPEVDICKDQR
jgi:lipopolysaccharide heptosyltransferase II